jgi:hypothetical protein
MTKRTRRLRLLCLPALGARALAGLPWPRSGINRENARRIQPGMTLEEVEAILGGPARDEASGPLAPNVEDGPQGHQQLALMEHLLIRRMLDLQFAPDARNLEWKSNRVMIWVQLDLHGRVGECNAFPMRRVGEGPLAMLRRWLRL